MVYLDSYLGFGQAPKIIYTSKPRPKTLEHKMKIGKWTRNAVLTLAAIVGIQALNPGVKQKEVNIAQTPDGIHEVAPEADKPSFGFGVSQAQAGGDQYFADLPSAVRAIENKSSALLNAFLAITHPQYHKTVYAPYGTSRKALIQTSLGFDKSNLNKFEVVTYEERTTSPLYFLLRARMEGRDYDINGAELKNILSINPSAEHLILGLNQLYTWDGADWWKKLKPQRKTFDGANAKIHFARGIFEIAQINQTDIEKINSRFNYHMNSSNLQDFTNEFVRLPNEQKNWIFDNIVQNKIEPMSKTLETTNLYWCLGMFYFSEHYDGIKGNESTKSVAESGLYKTLRDRLFHYKTCQGKLM